MIKNAPRPVLRWAAVVIALGVLGQYGCATPEEKPAPPPAPKAAPPSPVPAPAPAPAPPPPKPVAKPALKPLQLQSTALFEFDKAIVTPEGKNTLDSAVIARLKAFESISLLLVSGHADRIGTQEYNQKLSERRAEAVKAYLVSRGVEPKLIETIGFGKTLQIKSCPETKDQKELIGCLAPNRRVEIEVKGPPR